MNELCLILYEILCEALPLGISLGLLAAHCRQEEMPLSPAGLGAAGLMGLYIMAVLHFTGAGTLGSGLMLGLNLSHVNLIPFSQHPVSMFGYCLNILLFVPLGFLAPLIFRDCRPLQNTLGLGFGFSLLVEASQILSFRATDVDDLIMNTLGALAGWGLYRLTCRFLPRGNLPRPCLTTAVLAPFLGRFFLYYELCFVHWMYELRH